MATKKKYTDPTTYETKLSRVMERFDISDQDFTYNWDRHSAYIQFKYKGELYNFELSVKKAEDLSYGSDCFARLVLSLEDLARMINRGIYDLSTWVAGMKYLPPAVELPEYLTFLGFTEVPDSEELIDQRYKRLSKTYHPDQGGDQASFIKLKESAIKAKEYIKGR